MNVYFDSLTKNADSFAQNLFQSCFVIIVYHSLSGCKQMSVETQFNWPIASHIVYVSAINSRKERIWSNSLPWTGEIF